MQEVPVDDTSTPDMQDAFIDDQLSADVQEVPSDEGLLPDGSEVHFYGSETAADKNGLPEFEEVDEDACVDGVSYMEEHGGEACEPGNGLSTEEHEDTSVEEVSNVEEAGKPSNGLSAEEVGLPSNNCSSFAFGLIPLLSPAFFLMLLVHFKVCT